METQDQKTEIKKLTAIEEINTNLLKELTKALEEAKKIRGQYREIIEAVLKPTNFIHLDTARGYIVEALETYGLAVMEKE